MSSIYCAGRVFHGSIGRYVIIGCGVEWLYNMFNEWLVMGKLVEWNNVCEISIEMLNRNAPVHDNIEYAKI